MSSVATIGKWGNAQGIRLPKAFCDLLGIGVGDQVAISTKDNKIIIEPAEDQYTIAARKARDWDGKPLKAHEIDWGKPVGKEIW